MAAGYTGLEALVRVPGDPAVASPVVSASLIIVHWRMGHGYTEPNLGQGPRRPWGKSEAKNEPSHADSNVAHGGGVGGAASARRTDGQGETQPPTKGTTLTTRGKAIIKTMPTQRGQGRERGQRKRDIEHEHDKDQPRNGDKRKGGAPRGSQKTGDHNHLLACN